MTIVAGGLIASSSTVGVASGAIIGSITGLGVGILGAAVGTGTASGVAGATGSGAAAGAILGSVATAGIPGAIAGTIAGAVTAAATNAGTTSLGVTTILGTLSPPISAIILGTAQSETSITCTFDCWKPVLHDESCDPSNGKLLKEVIMDSRIKKVTATTNSDANLPQLILHNIWDEQFRIDYVTLPWGQLTAHAVKI